MSYYLRPVWPSDMEKLIHDWRRYISPDMRDSWQEFTDYQKQIIYENAQAIADGEEWE